MGEKCLKRILENSYCTKYNEINKGQWYIQKHMFSIKDDIKSTIILCTGLYKSFPIHCILRGKF